MTEEELKNQQEQEAGAGTEGTPAAESQEVVETPRMLLQKRMSAIYADDNYDENPDALDKRVMEYLDKVEGDNGSMKSFMDKLTARAQQSPTQAAVLIDWTEGLDWPSAIRKNMGDDALSMKEGDEGWDAFVQVQKDKDESYKKHKALVDEISANSLESQAAFEEFCKEEGLSEEEGNKLWDAMQAMLEDMSKGKYSKDSFKNFRRGSNYEADIEAAREQGRQEGADEKIKMERKRMQGSGLPGGSAGNGSAQTSPDTKDNETVRILKGIGKFR